MTLMFFFFNDTATTEIYTLSLHDALPIYVPGDLEDVRPAHGRGLLERGVHGAESGGHEQKRHRRVVQAVDPDRSGEHTAVLQLHNDLVCRPLLVKKKKYAMS